MKSMTVRLTGKSPLLMHNGRLADPLDEYAKALSKVSSIRSKTEADHEEMARLEWEGSLYLDREGRIGIPGINMRSMIVGPGGAARQHKQGKDAAKALRFDEFYPLSVNGNGSVTDYKALWNDSQYRHRVNVSIGRSTVIRTRPIFEGWAVDVTFYYHPDFADEDDVIHWWRVAGNEVGLGDWRPQKYGPYGTFDVEVVE